MRCTALHCTTASQAADGVPLPPLPVAAAEPASLARFRESEVFHCRWAMLGAAGVLGVEVLGEWRRWGSGAACAAGRAVPVHGSCLLVHYMPRQ